MKKVKLTGKLSLNKETVAKLNDEQMKSINGGADTDACRPRSSVVNCLQTYSCASRCNVNSCMC